MRNGALLLGTFSLLLEAACGSDPGLATAPGSSVLVAGVSGATMRSLGGGFGPQPPQGAPCDPGIASYAVTFQPAMLTFSRCRVVGDFNVAASYVPDAGQRALNAAELATAKAALGAVIVSDRRQCGADKGQLELQVDSASASLTYGDDFYGCSTQYQQFVRSEGLDNLSQVLDTLAG